jgi:hypothetical protein
MDSDHPGHAIALGGPPRFDEAGAPALFAFDESDFLRALDELLLAAPWPAREWPQRIAGRALGAAGEAIRLFQPVHRRFSLALLDAHCLGFGEPRLDPRRIVGSGLVLRRFIGPENPGPGELANPRHWQGWVGEESDAQGWVTFSSLSALDADPESTQGALARTGSAAVDALLAARHRSVKPVERTVPLWLARPEISSATGRTLLFGLIPTSSPAQQRSQADEVQAEVAALRNPSVQRQIFIDHLSSWLKLTVAKAPPRAGATFDRSWLTQNRIPDDEDEFIAFVEQLAYEFDAFGAGAARWRTRLASLRMWRFNSARFGPWKYDKIDPVAFLAACARIVRNDLGAAVAVPMPHLIGPAPVPFDPAPPPAPALLLQSFADEALASIEAVAASQPVPRGPYEDEGALYAVRAFVRVKADDARSGTECAPRLVWSAPSRLFTIAPWFESTGRPPPPIALPKLDRASLARLKPSTSFLLPPEIRRLVNPNGAQAMLAGNPRRSSLGIDWVLQLSMPIMTVCALAAMTALLALLDFVFRWIPFASILIPRIRR